MDEHKRHLLIFFKTGAVVKIDDLPEHFSFVDMCQQIRASGFFNNGYLYFPHENINGIAWVHEGQEVHFKSPMQGRGTLQ